MKSQACLLLADVLERAIAAGDGLMVRRDGIVSRLVAEERIPLSMARMYADLFLEYDGLGAAADASSARRRARCRAELGRMRMVQADWLWSGVDGG